MCVEIAVEEKKNGSTDFQSDHYSGTALRNRRTESIKMEITATYGSLAKCTFTQAMFMALFIVMRAYLLAVENLRKAALSLLHNHGSRTWAALANTFQVSSTTVSRIARGEPGAGVRVSNRMIQMINMIWQQRVLAGEQDLSSGDEVADRCTICLGVIGDDDPSVNLECSHSFHRTCVDEWFMRSAACPICRDEGNRYD